MYKYKTSTKHPYPLCETTHHLMMFCTYKWMTFLSTICFTCNPGVTDQENGTTFSVTRWKSPNVYKSCPKTISQEKLTIYTPLQKLPNNVGIWVKYLLPPALNGCPKYKKLPNLVTLRVITKVWGHIKRVEGHNAHWSWGNRIDDLPNAWYSSD